MSVCSAVKGCDYTVVGTFTCVGKKSLRDVKLTSGGGFTNTKEYFVFIDAMDKQHPIKEAGHYEIVKYKDRFEVVRKK